MRNNSRFSIAILIAAILSGLPAHAKSVDKETALIVGRKFMSARYGEQFSNLEMLHRQPYPHLYLLKNCKGTGFVIVSADDRLTPIVAHSNHSRVNDSDIPASVDAWLKEYERQIEYLFGLPLDIPGPITSDWKHLLGEASESPSDLSDNAVSPLLTTTWNQSPYYNNLCPSGTYTGCAATAMAQIMKYWNHPFVGIGQHSYTHSTYGAQSANFGNAYYSWSNMPTALVSSSSAAQKNAVATLMYHCGVAIDMNYGTDGSAGAVISHANNPNYPCVENALKRYFDYKQTVTGIVRNNHDDSLWFRILNFELNNGRPILYVGRPNIDGEGGHAFVVDGVDNANNYHINWGWGGSCDGYYALDVLHPYPSLAVYNFSYNQYALIGIEPNPTALKTLPESLSMSQTGSADTIWVRSNPQNTSSWSASCDQSWLHLSATSGPGGGLQTALRVSADANTSGNQRAATITIMQGAENTTVRVLQTDGTHSVSGWYGNEECGLIFFILPSHEYLIRPEAFGNFQRGSQLTKVKFNIYNDPRNRGNSVQVKIYEGNTLPNAQYGSRAQSLGQLVYSQSYPVSSPGIHEVLLDTPYPIPDKNFWVAIQPADTLVLWMQKSYTQDTIQVSQQNSYSGFLGSYLSIDNYYVRRMYGFDRLESDSTLVRPYDWMNTMSVYINTDTRYMLQVASSDPAKGYVNTVGGEYPNMSSVSLQATALPGYRFKQWSDGITANPRTINVWKDSGL